MSFIFFLNHVLAKIKIFFLNHVLAKIKMFILCLVLQAKEIGCRAFPTGHFKILPCPPTLADLDLSSGIQLVMSC